jgi:hypothetical protein
VRQIRDFEIFDTYLPPPISPPDRRFLAVPGRSGPFSSRFPPKGYLPTPTGLLHLTTLPWKKYATHELVPNRILNCLAYATNTFLLLYSTILKKKRESRLLIVCHTYVRRYPRDFFFQ